MVESGVSPYFHGLFSVQISPDGRWACLTALDRRLASRDIPFADFPQHPQADPGSATSILTGLQWIPCHSVIIFDLNTNRIVDPFIDNSIQPDCVMVISATFAPDGNSLLCAVLVDDSLWLTDSFFNKVTLYQIRIDDGSFDVRRILTTAISDSLAECLILSWLNNNSVLMYSWRGIQPNRPVRNVMPSVFSVFID